MLNVYACRLVARMTNNQFRWDVSVNQCPCNTMRVGHVFDASIFQNAHHSIAFVVHEPKPENATVRILRRTFTLESLTDSGTQTLTAEFQSGTNSGHRAPTCACYATSP